MTTVLAAVGGGAAVPAEGPWHPAAGGAGSNGAVAAHPVLCGCQLGAGHPDRKGRGTGHHLPGVPVPEAGADGGEQAQKEAEKAKAAKKPAKEKKPAEPRKKAKLTLNILCTILRGAGTLIRAVFGALCITHIRVCLGVRGEDPAAAARNYGKLQAWLYPVLGVLDRFIYLQFDELRIVPDFGSAEPTVEDRVSLRISARALFIVVAAVRVLAEFWREKVLDVFL